MNGADRDKVLRAVMKRAVGYRSKEKVDEFVLSSEGSLTLSKRRITEKDVPGDVAAARLLLDAAGADFSGMSDEQLTSMRDELLKRVSQAVKADGKGP